MGHISSHPFAKLTFCIAPLSGSPCAVESEFEEFRFQRREETARAGTEKKNGAKLMWGQLIIRHPLPPLGVGLSLSLFTHTSILLFLLSFRPLSFSLVRHHMYRLEVKSMFKLRISCLSWTLFTSDALVVVLMRSFVRRKNPVTPS